MSKEYIKFDKLWLFNIAIKKYKFENLNYDCINYNCKNSIDILNMIIDDYIQYIESLTNYTIKITY